MFRRCRRCSATPQRQYNGPANGTSPAWRVALCRTIRSISGLSIATLAGVIKESLTYPTLLG